MKRPLIWTLALGTLVLAGCGPGEVKTIAVSGTVMYQDKPLEGAAVTFVPGDVGAVSATGMTDAAGKFTLKTGLKDGAAAGKYVVAVSKMETKAVEMGNSKEATLKMTESPVMTDANLGKSLIPAKFASPATSGLTATVEAGKPNTFEFKLAD